MTDEAEQNRKELARALEDRDRYRKEVAELREDLKHLQDRQIQSEGELLGRLTDGVFTNFIERLKKWRYWIFIGGAVLLAAFTFGGYLTLDTIVDRAAKTAFVTRKDEIKELKRDLVSTYASTVVEYEAAKREASDLKKETETNRKKLSDEVAKFVLLTEDARNKLKRAEEVQFRAETLIKVLASSQEPLMGKAPNSDVTKIDSATKIQENYVDYRQDMLPVQDQGDCGSNVGFAIAQAFEYQVTRAFGKKIRLSPAQIFFYLAGGTCLSGGNIDPALDNLQRVGAVSYEVWPYPAQSPRDKTKAKSTNHYQLQQWSRVFGIEDRKAAILKTGPVIAIFKFSKSFLAYRSGVYSTSPNDDLVASIPLTVVGYDDLNKSWICQNSWGKGWGDKGYCRIAYGDASGIDTVYPFYILEGVKRVKGEPVAPKFSGVPVTKEARAQLQKAQLPSGSEISTTISCETPSGTVCQVTCDYGAAFVNCSQELDECIAGCKRIESE
jgi:C1A family cysteine protease